MANKNDVIDANNFVDKRILLFSREDSFIYFVLKKSRLIKVVVEKTNAYNVSDVIMATITKKAMALGAYFCKLDKSTEAFLPFDEFVDKNPAMSLRVGDTIPVIIKKAAYDNKKALVSPLLELASDYGVVRLGASNKPIAFSKKIEKVDRDRIIDGLQEEKALLNEYGINVLIRSKCTRLDLALIKANIGSLINEFVAMIGKTKFALPFTKIASAKNFLYKAVLANDKENEPLKIICEDSYTYDFARSATKDIQESGVEIIEYKDESIPLQTLYGLKAKFDEITREKVMLPCGGYLFITPTPALVAIDVNAGKIDKKKNKEETALLVNLEAARAIAYHIEARNLSGILIIDFINMNKEENVTILTKSVKELLMRLEREAKLVDITKLGLAEVTVEKKDGLLYENYQFINSTILM